MTEAIGAKLDALQKAMDTGFRGVNRRLDTMDTDVKSLREEGLPRRVGRLEKDVDSVKEKNLDSRVSSLQRWRERIQNRWWAFAAAGGVAILSAWLAVLVDR